MSYEKELLLVVHSRTNDKSGETRTKDRKEDEGSLLEYQPVWQLWVLSWEMFCGSVESQRIGHGLERNTASVAGKNWWVSGASLRGQVHEG